jgi:superfamily II DNA/RNA helicase
MQHQIYIVLPTRTLSVQVYELVQQYVFDSYVHGMENYKIRQLLHSGIQNGFQGR